MRSSAALVDLVRRRPVTALLVWFLTVGQLIAFIPVLAEANGDRLAREPFSIASTLVGLLLPALVVVLLVDGPAAVRDLLGRATAARPASPWYAVVLGVIPLIRWASRTRWRDPRPASRWQDWAWPLSSGSCCRRSYTSSPTTCGRRSRGPASSKPVSKPITPRYRRRVDGTAVRAPAHSARRRRPHSWEPCSWALRTPQATRSPPAPSSARASCHASTARTWAPCTCSPSPPSGWWSSSRPGVTSASRPHPEDPHPVSHSLHRTGTTRADPSETPQREEQP
jgi:hypothetical protein